MSVVSFPNTSTAQPLQRALPINLDAEQAVLGAIMLRNDCLKAMAHLQPEHFFEELHQRIFSIARDLIADGKLATPMTIKTFLDDHDIGGLTTMQYLAKLASNAIPPATAPHYAKLLIDLHTRRSIITTINGYLDSAHDAPADTAPAIIAASAGQQLLELSRTGTDDSSRVESGAAAVALVERGEAIRRGEVIRECCSTGFKDIDAATGGYEAGLFWIIGARPSMGKSTFSIASAARVAGKAMRGEEGGAGVLVFSLEDDEKQAMARLLSMSCYSQTSPIEYRQILAAKDLDDYAFQRLRRNAEKLSDYPLTMDFASRPTVEQVAYKIRLEKDRMAKRGYRLGVVFIDYLKKMQASGRYQGNRNLEFGEITGKLKDVCRDEQVCIVLFSQLNRATVQSEDKRPTLANLRDSGEIEEDGNVVAFLHRENYYITRSAEYKQHDDAAIQRALATERELEFLIEKNKSGPIGTKKLFVDLASNYIADYEKWRTA